MQPGAGSTERHIRFRGWRCARRHTLNTVRLEWKKKKKKERKIGVTQESGVQHHVSNGFNAATTQHDLTTICTTVLCTPSCHRRETGCLVACCLTSQSSTRSPPLPLAPSRILPSHTVEERWNPSNPGCSSLTSHTRPHCLCTSLCMPRA